jgi:lysophospholipase L1-like esterase
LSRPQLVARAAVVACMLIVVYPGVAGAQEPSTAPTLQIEQADLSQSGDDLVLELTFSRELPVAQIDPSKGRYVCLVLAPASTSRRRVCISNPHGHLRAALTPIDENGRANGQAKQLGRAQISAEGSELDLRASADALRVKLGGDLPWQALVVWHDDGPCTQAATLPTCTQTVEGRTLHTRESARPAFVRERHLRVLATGDSMIQYVDNILKARLQRRRSSSVRSDARISTGLSKPSLLNWVKKAGEQARSVHPDVTAIFIGANDGFAMKTPRGASVACCGDGWVAEYARRVEAMMRSYLRGGRSYVYWMTLPAPNRPDFARVYRAVNMAIKRAARVVGRGARVIDLVPVFTPGFRFRQHVTFRGKTVNARQGDGVHLSIAGAGIAATLLIDRLRADHALPALR